jgi:hypothetical protein
VAATTVDPILGEFWGFAYYYDRDGYVGMSDNRDGGVLDIDFPASLTTLYLTFLSHGDPENLATLKAFYVIGTAGWSLPGLRRMMRRRAVMATFSISMK